MDEPTPTPQPNNDGAGEGKPPADPTPPKGGEGKPGGEPGNPQKTEGAPTGTQTVPEKYDLQIPKGIKAGEGYVASVAKYAKEHKLNNQQAQAVLNRDVNLRASIIKGQREELDTQMTGWAEAAKTDGEIGGDNFNQSVELAKRVVQKFATPAFIDRLNETGLGNHPEVIRLFARVGKHLKDDSFVFSKTEAPKEKSLEDVFYGDSNKKPQ